MKKISIISFCIITIAGRAQWLTNLNDGRPHPQLGTNTSDPLSFYTNSSLRMTLDADGKLGIGKADPAAALDVIGDGTFSGNLKIQNSFSFSDNFKLEYTPSITGKPSIFVATPFPHPVSSFKFMAPCNVWYKDPTQYDPYTGAASSVVWSPPTTNVYYDLMQVYPSTQQLSVISLGILNGDGILGLEALPTNPSTTQRLKINPGCANDVFICEGGGYTKIFNGAGVIGDIDVSNRVKIGAAPFGTQSSLEIKAASFLTKVISASGTTGSTLFEVANDGKTFIKSSLGIGTTASATTFLNVYNPVSSQGNTLLNIGVGSTPNVFNIGVDGLTTLNANTQSTYIFKVKNSNTDLFEITATGIAYAREMIVTLGNFPDYVFSKDYKLMPIKEVKNFINKNHRLPNMPSASEVATDGAKLGEIQRLTVEKVEELYLYILQLEEKVADLNRKLDQKKN